MQLSMYTRKSSAQRGFSLVEIIVYIAIFTLILGALAALVVGILRALASETALLDVERDQVVFVRQVDEIFRTIASVEVPIADAVDTVFEGVDDDGVEYLLYESDGVLYLDVNGETRTLTSESVFVESVLVEYRATAQAIGVIVTTRARDQRLSQVTRTHEYWYTLANYE